MNGLGLFAGFQTHPPGVVQYHGGNNGANLASSKDERKGY